MVIDAALILVGYLIGSLPFAYIITRVMTGKDIRNEGEGNVGGRNVGYVVSVPAGIATTLLDMAKAAAASLLVQRFATQEWTAILAGLAVLAGHGFPVWLRFKGGKGLACAAGYLLPIFALPVSLGLAAFLVVSFGLKRFNLGAGVGVFTLLGLVFFGSAGLPWITRLAQVGMIVILFAFTGFKKIVDYQHEQHTRAHSGWVEGSNNRPIHPGGA